MGRRKTPTELRAEAADICEEYADERSRCGDPESAEIFLDAALEIRKLSLTGPPPVIIARPFTPRTKK